MKYFKRCSPDFPKYNLNRRTLTINITASKYKTSSLLKIINYNDDHLQDFDEDDVLNQLPSHVYRSSFKFS